MIELKVARGCKAPRPWGGLAVSPCPWQERCFVEIQDGGQGAECSARAAVQWLLCPCSTSPAEQPQVPWQCPQGECPLLVTPGGWQWESQPQCPQGMCHRAQPQPAGEAGLHCQPPPSTHLTCRMSPAVSLATAMASRTPRAEFPCIPCDVSPVSRVTQHPGALAGRYWGSPAAFCCAQPLAT